MNEELEKYLAEVARQLSVDPAMEREILREIRSHLEEAMSELQEDGLSEEDSVAQATDNFGEAQEVGRMLGRLHNESDWVKVGLAILPGLFALGISSRLFRSPFGATIAENVAQSGLLALCVLLVGVGLVRERRIAVWSFPALGILLFPASVILLSISWWVPLPFAHEDSAAWYIGPFALLAAVLAGIGAFAVYRVYRQHRFSIPRPAWSLLGLVILVTMAGLVTSTMADRSPNKWMALLAMLPPTLFWMGVILLPVAIGLPLARRNGLLAGLIVVAAEFVLVDEIFDPAYALGLWTSDPTVVRLVSVIPAVFFLVVSPIWVLRSRSTTGRAGGLLLPALIALVGAEMISGGVRPYYSDTWHWLTRAIGCAQFLTALALAAVMYHWVGQQGEVAGISEGRWALAEEAGTVGAGEGLSTG